MFAKHKVCSKQTIHALEQNEGKVHKEQVKATAPLSVELAIDIMRKCEGWRAQNHDPGTDAGLQRQAESAR